MMNTILALGLGTPEIILILVVALLLFGGKKLPELARGLGRGLRLFKDEMNGVKNSLDDTTTPQTKEPEHKSEPPVK
ncbi:MAG: twin-arginine translocase TatA/TatE family subunit [Planctomycetaceae bacterium]|nr:twin-arginine translocase TatA/TatE family subunit [Planctomycetaceae bacterium]